MKPEDRVHSGIRLLQPYVPGKPIEEVARELGLKRIVKLASNENPLGPSPKALVRMRQVANEMHRYPDGPATVLKEKLAAKFDLPPDALFFGNGSNELLELALRTFVLPGETVVSAQVTFSVYGILAQAHGARYVTACMDGVAYDLDALAQTAIREQAKLVFIANPNNPTGSAFDKAALDRFLDCLPPQTLVVYDAAYAEYAGSPTISDGRTLLRERDNVLVTRTFSKAYGLAGIRVGWGFAPPTLADFINRVRQPFNLNRMAHDAAVAALDDEAFLQQTLDLNKHGILWLRQQLSELGLTSYESHANFVLFEAPRPADALFQQLLHEGVIVRSMSSFGLPRHIRVNTGTQDENEFFIAALKRVLARGA